MTLLRKLSRLRSSKAKRSRHKSPRGLFFEPLEARQVLSTILVDFSVPGELKLTDQDDLAADNDSLTMSFNAGMYEIQETGDAVLSLSGAPVPGITLAAGLLTFDPALFGDVEIAMATATDTVTIDSFGTSLAG